MDDQTPMPETLDTLATKILALGKTIDARFAEVDQQFAKVDQQFAKVDQQFAKVDQQFAKVDQQFAKVDQQFDKVDSRFVTIEERLDEAEKQRAEMKAHLEIKIESLGDTINLVYDAVIAQNAHNEANERAHTAFTNRLENHEVRILALEPHSPEDR